jgi:hypothetical protein
MGVSLGWALDRVCSMAGLIERRVFGGNQQMIRSDVVPRSRR